jgi:hypothetical protein
MPQKYRQRLDISHLRDETRFERPLKHQGDVECRPRRGPRSHILLDGIHIIPAVTNFFAQQFTADRCRFRASQSLWTVEVISFAEMSVGGKRNRGDLGNISDINN